MQSYKQSSIGINPNPKLLSEPCLSDNTFSFTFCSKNHELVMNKHSACAGVSASADASAGLGAGANTSLVFVRH